MIREKSLKRLLEEGDNEKEVGRHWHRRIISLGLQIGDYLMLSFLSYDSPYGKTFACYLVSLKCNPCKQGKQMLQSYS